MNKPTYIVHSHYSGGRVLDISERVTSGAWRRSLEPPYGGCTFSMKCRYVEKHALINVGDWVTIHDPYAVAYDMFYVDKVTYSLDNYGPGNASHGATVSCITWMELLGRTQFYVPQAAVESVGTVLNIEDWSALLDGTIQQGYLGQDLIGKSLAHFFSKGVRIKLPASLGGETLGDAIRVVYDKETAKLYAPALHDTIDPVVGFSGLPKNVSPSFYLTSILEIMNKLYVGSQLLVEMIPYMVYGELGSESVRPKLVSKLGCRPILLYRFKPWREEPLYDAVTTWEDFRRVNNKANAPHVADQGMAPWADPQIAGGPIDGFNPATDKVRADLQATLNNKYNNVTWSLAAAKEIPFSAVRRLSDTVSDADRVNLTTVRFSLDGGTGAEGDPALGMPLINRDGVENHGARVMRPEWTFLLYDPKSPVAALDYRAIAAQAMQWHVNGHKLASGVLSIDPLDASAFDALWSKGDSGPPGAPMRVQHVWSGDIVKCQIRSNLSPYMCYAHTVSHAWNTDPNTGAVTLNCDITFIRGGHASDTLVRKGRVPVERLTPLVSAASAGAIRGAAKGAGTQPALTDAILADGNDVPIVGGGAVLRWLIDFGQNIPTTLLPNRISAGIPGSITRGTFPSPLNNAGRPVRSVVIHYTDGSLNSDARRVRNMFQRSIDRYPATPPIGTHFIIDPTGAIMQIYDIARLAYHAEYASHYSVGIDLVVPQFFKYKGIAQETKNANNSLLWTVRNNDWYIVSERGNPGPAQANFFSASKEQEESLIKLLRTLKTLGFVMTHHRGVTQANAVKRYGRDEAVKLLTAGGVFHHLQFNRNRVDSLGTDLTSIVGRV